jgi:tRNA-Thr(GGU) m(6)t(6)A37 methyltransferase TsaA
MNQPLNQPVLQTIGVIRSALKSLDDCPLQGQEGAPEAWIELDPAYIHGIDNLEPGSEVILLTWFHQANRSVITCYPRKQTTAPHVGVFTTRSPDRPNPIGLHQVTVQEIAPGGKIKVYPLEALDGTPLIDIKPVI